MRLSLTAIVLLTVSAIPAHAAPAPGPLQSFGDWSVACDNVKLCEATSLPISADNTDYPDKATTLSVVRAAGPGGEMRIEADIGTGDPVAMLVDGKQVARAAPAAEVTVFTGAAVEPALRAMAIGKTLTLTGGGKTIGSISLAGMSATLRFIDAAQGRAGTASAIVAKGAKPASSVPPPPPMPVVTAVRATGTAAAISAALDKSIRAMSECDAEDMPAGNKLETHALGGGATLVLVPCGAGAYNVSTVALVVRGGRAMPANFDSPPGFTAVEDGMPTLVNAGWDAKSGQLSSYSKGRGLGDCGSSESYVWDGKSFQLIEARAMGECRGSVNWLRIWVAEVR